MSPLFLLGVGTGCDFHVHAWNKDYPPTNWLNVCTPAGAVPKGWYFFAVTLKEGGVGKGALRVTLNDATYDLATQKVERDVPSECDFVGYKMSGAVIDELTVFQRALSDDEILALRELGRNNVPLSRAEAASPPPATPFTDADVRRIAALPAAAAGRGSAEGTETPQPRLRRQDGDQDRGRRRHGIQDRD